MDEAVSHHLTVALRHFTEALKHLRTIESIRNEDAAANAIILSNAVPFLAGRLEQNPSHEAIPEERKLDWMAISLLFLFFFVCVFTAYLVGIFTMLMGRKRDIMYRYEKWKEEQNEREQEEQLAFYKQYGKEAVEKALRNAEGPREMRRKSPRSR